MVKTNQDTFAFLKEQLEEKLGRPVETGRRYIKTNEIEKKWLKELSITTQNRILPNLKGINISYDSNNYLIIVGVNIDTRSLDDDVIFEQDINAGILTVLLSEKSIRLEQTIDPLSFYNDIMFQHEGDDYKGHDFEEVLNYLEPIHIFEIPNDSILKTACIYRILCYVLSKNTHLLTLEFDSPFLNLVSRLSLGGSNKISFSLILNSLLAFNFEYSFLELYKLIEKLFSVNYIREFYRLSNSELPFFQFTAKLEDVTSWRPKEEDALEKIFENSREETITVFTDCIRTIEAFREMKESKFLYKLRNSIVHFRANHQGLILLKNQWNVILLGSLTLIDEHYSINHEFLA